MPRELAVTEIREKGTIASPRDGSKKIGTEPIGPVPAPEGPWPVRHRYLLLATAVTVLTSIQTANGQWSSDMWEHVAVVRGEEIKGHAEEQAAQRRFAQASFERDHN